MLVGVIEVGQITDVLVLVVGACLGVVAWRSKRGEFYKAVAEEKSEQVDKLLAENTKLREATDITPIIDTLRGVSVALEKHAKTIDAVFQKVADMNGSLRHHSEAMKALADRLILDEAARALLTEAAARKSPSTQRRDS